MRDEATGRFVKKDIHYRKKICTGCGRNLYLGEFYKMKNRKNFPDGHDCRCKECRRKEKNASYAKRKVPDGLRMDSQGVVRMHKGASSRIYWSEEKMRRFRSEFPFNTNEDLAIDFECSPRTVVRRAREMQLEKDPRWLAAKWERNRKIMHRVNRACGNKADLTNFLEAAKKHQFQPGKGAQLTPEQKSLRMKKAWETRHHNMLRQKSTESNNVAKPQ